MDSLLSKDEVEASDITWLSSPFLRTLQTSDNMLNLMTNINSNSISILPEYSVFEWDGHGGEWHACLPTMQERSYYFPRLDASHESLFIPDLPEPKADFQGRCNRAIEELNKKYTFKPKSAVVIISHAAGCVGLSVAASQKTLQDITPAAPCSVFRLSRSSNSDVWDLDDHDKEGGLNGHTNHLSTLGESTVPWNHFADKSKHRGYTGPPTSRFAPQSIKDEL